jgi:hypothetical protein
VQWRSFACEHCERVVHYHYGREYRYCSYRCAGVVWVKRAAARRASARARVRVKQLTCEVCGEAFTAARSDARTCSPACRKRAQRARRAATGGEGRLSPA